MKLWSFKDEKFCLHYGGIPNWLGHAEARRAQDRHPGSMLHTSGRACPICGELIVYEWFITSGRGKFSPIIERWRWDTQPCVDHMVKAGLKERLHEFLR